ncbi:hypothetical protein D915_000221 [Fasciola hepatica]|uniref:Uncharacterized protein n=1 Tax=Fasciola hepatica TaxID=6192 RepID=A0A4E0RMT5_FASHE|nr:hypothetical protein D915_000221 [Fasciola hepatica]
MTQTVNHGVYSFTLICGTLRSARKKVCIEGLFKLLTPEWRRSSLATVLVAPCLALIGLALMLYFLRFWMRTLTMDEHRGYERLSVSFILFVSGFTYKLTLFFLHLEYLREKVTYSRNLPYIFTSWELVLRRNTEITYAYCYDLLWVSLILVELAAIILLLSVLLICCLESEADIVEKTINYRLSLPRYSTWDTSRPLPEMEEDDDETTETLPVPQKNAVYFDVQ